MMGTSSNGSGGGGGGVCVCVCVCHMMPSRGCGITFVNYMQLSIKVDY